MAEKLENFFLVSCVDISACGFKQSFGRQMAVNMSLAVFGMCFAPAIDLDTEIPTMFRRRRKWCGNVFRMSAFVSMDSNRAQRGFEVQMRRN